MRDYTKMACVINPLIKPGVVYIWAGPVPYLETDSVRTYEVFLASHGYSVEPKPKRKRFSDEEFMKAVGFTL
jgi:hypothetical protein